MVTKVEKLEAELKLAKLEEKFLVAKAAGKATPKLKLQVREARQDFRENFRGVPAGAVVNPATVTTKAGIK